MSRRVVVVVVVAGVVRVCGRDFVNVSYTSSYVHSFRRYLNAYYCIDKKLLRWTRRSTARGLGSRAPKRRARARDARARDDDDGDALRRDRRTRGRRGDAGGVAMRARGRAGTHPSRDGDGDGDGDGRRARAAASDGDDDGGARQRSRSRRGGVGRGRTRRRGRDWRSRRLGREATGPATSVWATPRHASTIAREELFAPPATHERVLEPWAKVVDAGEAHASKAPLGGWFRRAVNTVSSAVTNTANTVGTQVVANGFDAVRRGERDEFQSRTIRRRRSNRLQGSPRNKREDRPICDNMCSAVNTRLDSRFERVLERVLARGWLRHGRLRRNSRIHCETQSRTLENASQRSDGKCRRRHRYD